MHGGYQRQDLGSQQIQRASDRGQKYQGDLARGHRGPSRCSIVRGGGCLPYKFLIWLSRFLDSSFKPLYTDFSKNVDVGLIGEGILHSIGAAISKGLVKDAGSIIPCKAKVMIPITDRVSI